VILATGEVTSTKHVAVVVSFHCEDDALQDVSGGDELRVTAKRAKGRVATVVAAERAIVVVPRQVVSQCADALIVPGLIAIEAPA
jgi:hypothetical protein